MIYHTQGQQAKPLHPRCSEKEVRVRVMVFNTTFNNISVIVSKWSNMSDHTD
jgi:hypothetical protein